MMTVRTLNLLGAIVVPLIVALSAGSALAQWGGRAVNVNGRWLNPMELAEADRAVGYLVPNGYYWYDAQTGRWGRMDAPGAGPRPTSPFTSPLIDPRGGCEGGSCVIIPRY